MSRNNHSPRSDADRLRQVDRLVNEGQTSGEPVLDSLRVHIPRADAARAQSLEDELVAMWDGGVGVNDDTAEQPYPALMDGARLAQPNRAGRLPYVATLAAMVAVVAAVVLLNRPLSPGTASQDVVTVPAVITATPVVTVNPIITPTVVPVVTMTPVIEQATQISQPAQPPNPPAEKCYIVQADDTIESIAQENGISAEQILQSNVEIAQAVETDEGIVYRLWLSPASCLRLSPPTPVPGGIVSIIAPYSLLVPRDAGQPRRLEVGDRISLYVGIVDFSMSGQVQPFDPAELKLLASNVQVMAILDHADEYVISIPQELHPIIAWLWQDTVQTRLIYELE